jgi:hypothetical protein
MVEKVMWLCDLQSLQVTQPHKKAETEHLMWLYGLQSW